VFINQTVFYRQVIFCYSANWGHLTTNYILGCYACQLGDMDNAKRFVGDAIKLDSKYKLMALDDADLEPLWDSLASL